MDPLVGTPQCPHLGFETQRGLPCCHADDLTRQGCGKGVPNPAARRAGAAAGISGVEPYFCAVHGTDSLPAEALQLARAEKAAQARRAAPPPKGFRPPNAVTGHAAPRAEPADAEGDPVIPTHTLRNEGRKPMPNQPCPCGSGKKYKKCCGTMG